MSDIQPGQWVVFNDGWGVERYIVAEAVKATEKRVVVKKYGSREGFATRDSVAAVFATKEAADQLVQALDGARGEYNRRVAAARLSLSETVARLIERSKA